MKPVSFRPWRNAATRKADVSGDCPLMNPITGIAACCARAENGHVAAAPPTRLMNSRRLIAAPDVQDKTSYRLKATLGKGARCPLWVISGHLHCNRSCPLYPQKRTCSVQLGMSAMGQ